MTRFIFLLFNKNVRPYAFQCISNQTKKNKNVYFSLSKVSFNFISLWIKLVILEKYANTITNH